MAGGPTVGQQWANIFFLRMQDIRSQVSQIQDLAHVHHCYGVSRGFMLAQVQIHGSQAVENQNCRAEGALSFLFQLFKKVFESHSNHSLPPFPDVRQQNLQTASRS